MKNKTENTTKFVVRILEYAKCGPIMQMFAIGAIDVYTNSIIAEPPKEPVQGFNSEQWLTAAKIVWAEMHNRPPKGESNAQFFRRIMQRGAYAPIIEIMIIGAFKAYCQMVIANPPKEKELLGGFVASEAWMAAAKELHTELEKRTTQNPAEPTAESRNEV